MPAALPYVASVIAFCLLAACGNGDGTVASPEEGRPAGDKTDLAALDFSVEEAGQWSSLFRRDSGWFGGDGIFSVSLPAEGGSAPDSARTMIWFSDTMIGQVSDGVLQPGYTMVHNSVALLRGTVPGTAAPDFFWKGRGTPRAESLFEPPGHQSADNGWYWLGDGFVNHAKGDDLYIFAYGVEKTATAAGFGVSKSILIIIPKGSPPPYDDQRQLETPLFVSGTTPDNGYAFGAGVFVNTTEAGAPDPDGYLYVYGVKNGPAAFEKDLMVGRVPPASVADFAKWRFWDGASWNLGVGDIARAAVITTRVSDELSLTPLPDGRYALVFQTDGIGSSVGMRLASHPWGPFGPLIKVWDCPEATAGKGYVTYNAKAQPALSGPGELVISYNVNAGNFFTALQQDPHLYRPRFIKLTLH